MRMLTFDFMSLVEYYKFGYVNFSQVLPPSMGSSQSGIEYLSREEIGLDALCIFLGQYKVLSLNFCEDC